jgi:hypothetical protein
MHGATREDLPRAPQILSDALIRVLPDGFLLKAIVLRYVNINISSPPQLSPLATALTLCHMFYQWSHVRLDFVAFPFFLKEYMRSCPKQNSSDQNGIIQFRITCLCLLRLQCFSSTGFPNCKKKTTGITFVRIWTPLSTTVAICWTQRCVKYWQGAYDYKYSWLIKKLKYLCKAHDFMLLGI